MRLSPLRVALTVSSTKCGLPAHASGTASARALSTSTVTRSRRTRQLGGDDYLVKPIDSDEFLARVRRAIAARSEVR